MNPNDQALTSPTSMVVLPSDQNSQGYLLNGNQVPNGMITPLMLAATPTVANGDTYYSNGTTFVRLPVGTSNQVLTTIAGVPAWQTLSIPLSPTDGWITTSATLTYASATSVTTSGSVIAYPKGTRVKFTNNSTTFYGIVASTSGSTINFIPNNDYAVNNSAISNPFYSYQINPQGYPGWFNYTVSWGGFSVNPSGGITRFAGVGTICFVEINEPSNGTSNSTSLTFTLPVNAGQTLFIIATPFVVDNNAAQTSPGRIDLTSGSTTAVAYKTLAEGAWTSTSGKNVITNFFYEF